MNIFVLDKDPMIAASYHCDRHIVKMIIESCQMLANVFTEDELKHSPKTIIGSTRKHSYLHHPCSKWVLESFENFEWLLNLAECLCDEYNRRYNKIHFSSKFIKWVRNNKNLVQIPHRGLTSFAQAMPEKYKNKDEVVAYRSYYIGEKLRFARYKNSKFPEWLKRCE